MNEHREMIREILMLGGYHYGQDRDKREAWLEELATEELQMILDVARSKQIDQGAINRYDHE